MQDPSGNGHACLLQRWAHTPSGRPSACCLYGSISCAAHCEGGLICALMASLLSWSGHSQRQHRNEPLQEKKRKENSLLPRRNTVLFENSWGLGSFVLVFNPQSLEEVCAHCSPIKHLGWKRTLPAPAPAIRAALIPSSTRPGAAAEPRSTPRPLGQRSNGKAALHHSTMRAEGGRTAALRSSALHQPRSPSVIHQSHKSAALPSPGQRAATKAARHSCAPPAVSATTLPPTGREATSIKKGFV